MYLHHMKACLWNLTLVSCVITKFNTKLFGFAKKKRKKNI